MTTVREELTQIADIEQKNNETWTKFANRLVRTIDKKEVSEEDWAQLSPEAQEWFNSAVEAITAGSPIKGFPDEAEPEAKSSGKGGAKKAKAEGAKSSGNGRPKRLTEDQTIHLKVDENPKRAGSKAASVFDLYRDGMTVKEALEAGIPRNNMNWDLDHGFIDVK